MKRYVIQYADGMFATRRRNATSPIVSDARVFDRITDAKNSNLWGDLFDGPATVREVELRLVSNLPPAELPG